MTERSEETTTLQMFKLLTATDDGHFAIDTIRNVFWFCVIGLAALGLQNFVTWTEQHGGSAVLVLLLTSVEYAVLVADVVWFLSRLFVGSYKIVIRAYQDIIAAKTAARLSPTGSIEDQ
ncbi:MAG: hypothetical protein PHQ60_13640 [Sideroxydans sp.]|nr:hypothetical protein [Sideroxydans sp.]